MGVTEETFVAWSCTEVGGTTCGASDVADTRVVLASKAKRKESLIQTFYETSAPTFLIDWHLLNQPTKITFVACFFSTQIFRTWENCTLADIKNSFYLLKIKQSAQSCLTSCMIKGDVGVISVGVEGKEFSKRQRHDVQVLIFLLGTLEFKIRKFLFFLCLCIFLGNFPLFSVHKSLKIMEK